MQDYLHIHVLKSSGKIQTLQPVEARLRIGREFGCHAPYLNGLILQSLIGWPKLLKIRTIATSALLKATARLALRQNRVQKRSSTESIYSSVKRNFACRALGRTLDTQSRHALLSGLAVNLAILQREYLSMVAPQRAKGI
jgi:hypothetical protein